jgi:membrane protease YdiL (CAAX protease family)
MNGQERSRGSPQVLAALGVPLYLALFWVALWTPRWIGYPRNTFAPSSVVTHGLMLLGTIAAALVLGRTAWSRFGFIRGTYRFRPGILLWVLPTAIPTSLGLLSKSPAGRPRAPFEGSALQTILFVWVVASICEEVFARGLLQGLLSAWSKRGIRLFGRWFIGLPAWISGLLFGLGHLVLWPMMGPMTILICISATLLGIVAGTYRQATGSLIPAILVHLLFNVGGTLPAWLSELRWLR